MQRFLCDEMMVRLGKWLRAAGYDTRIASSGAKDRDLLDCAIREERILLTRDRKFLERRGAAGIVFLLSGNNIQNWVTPLSQAFDIDWLYAPFSRCLICNGELKPGAGPHAQAMPDYVVRENIPCFYCSNCAKPYWRGGHVERMSRKLKLYQSMNQA